MNNNEKNRNIHIWKTDIYKDIMDDFIDEDGFFDEDAYIAYMDKASIHSRWDNQTVRFHGNNDIIKQGQNVNPITEHYFNCSDDEKSAIVKAIDKSENSLFLSNDEIYAIHSDHYLNVDDDEYSPLGAAIFENITGISIEELLDEDNDDE